MVVLLLAAAWFAVDRLGITASDIADLRNELGPPRPGELALALVLLSASDMIAMFLWRQAIADLGGPRLGILEGLALFGAGNLARYLPGGLWHFAGLAVLGAEKGVSVALSSAAAVLTHVASVLTAFLVGITVFFTGPDVLRPWAPWAVAAVGAGVAVASVPSVFRAVSRRLIQRAKAQAESGGDEPTAASLEPAAGPRGLYWMGAQLVVWLGRGTAFWLLANGVGIQIELELAVTAFAAAHAVGFVVFLAPAGVGVRDGSLVLLLTQSIGLAPAAALALATRVWMTLTELITVSTLMAVSGTGRRPPLTGSTRDDS